MDDATELTLESLAAYFLDSLSPRKRQKTEPSINKFIRWCGRDRLAINITGREVERYALGLSVAAATLSSPHVRAFLNYAHKQGTFQLSLAPSFRVRKSKTTAKQSSKRASTVSQLSEEGFERINSELSDLKSKRGSLAEAIQKAAADKDFRENAPLEAAREDQGRVESRILELEAILRTSVLLTDDQSIDHVAKVLIGRTVTLENMSNGQNVKYRLVSPSEAKLAEGKISIASPVGKALLGRSNGDEVEVTAPVGTLRFRILEVVS